MTTSDRVLCISVSDRGAALAEQLPFEHLHGELVATVQRRWDDVSALVLFCATGIAVRAVAPLLRDKAADPAVVCVDDGGEHAIALVGGHAAGANALARDVASVLGAVPVVTTATDVVGVPALDQLPGVAATGDLAVVTAALLDGRAPAVHNPRGWPVPALAWLDAAHLSAPRQPGAEQIVITDERVERIEHAESVGRADAATVVLHPPSLVVGVGTSRGAPVDELAELVRSALIGAGLAPESVALVASADLKADEPAVVALPWPLRTYPVDVLAAVAVPHPSDVVRDAVGTGSVAEAAALLGAGPGSELVVAKQRSAHATVAVARRAGPEGRLAVVGLGPGVAAHRTPAAARAVRHAETVIGYGPYVDQCADLLTPAQRVVRSPIGAETDRARAAVAAAAGGERVALVCSGDAGVYAMASLVLEVAAAERTLPLDAIEVVPGVTAALAASAVLGAPLGHDHVSISLSDLLTPWEAIEARLHAAAEADLVVCLYNPRSHTRDWQLDVARRILAEHRPAATPVGIVGDAGRASERCVITTLADLDPATVDMTTLVVVGSSTTYVVDGRMVTPRGYKP